MATVAKVKRNLSAGLSCVHHGRARVGNLPDNRAGSLGCSCRSQPLRDRCDGMRIALRVLTDQDTGEMIVRPSSNELDMLTLDARAHCGLSSPTSVNTTPTRVSRGAERTTKPEPSVEHDGALLVAALEAVEVRRAALEWLLEADLLCLCLV
jgi:hypothetical protein